MKYSEYHLRKVRNHISSRLSNAKNRKGKHEHSVEVTPEDLVDLYIMQEGKCALSGRTLFVKKQWNRKPKLRNGKRRKFKYVTPNPLSLSIDRIDSNKDYTIDNVQLTCWMANYHKQQCNNNRFIDLCKDIALYTCASPLTANFTVK